jgi:acyl-CoA reductase-like NAD-dependent aldehyde dehydrogenase
LENETMTDRPVLDTSAYRLDHFYSGGAWQKALSGAMTPLVSPNTESVFAHVASAGAADVERAVAAARTAFDDGPWPRLTPQERADWLRRLSAALQKRKAELALCWTEEIGVPYRMAQGMTGWFLGILDGYAALADGFPFVAEKPIASPGAGILAYAPVGVVAAIAPWNVPISIMLNKIGPALLAGCTVVMKPAPETPLETYILAECADEIGLPAGVLNLIAAEREASAMLVAHPDIDKVSFTGSSAAGRSIAVACAERIARCSLELGGKSAAIVLDDYDLEEAAKSLVGGICGLAGQNCAALSRVIVSRERHDALVAALKARCEAVKIGGAYDPEATLGTLAMARQRDQVERFIAAGIAEGATLVTGGRRAQGVGPGYFIEPTVFANVDNAMTIAQEEIFGPVLCVIAADDLDDAVRIANASRFGLAGAVYTHDVDLAYAVARRMRTGTVGQSGPLADFSIGFGGFKQSGIGREGGVQGLMAYLEPQTLLMSGMPTAL